LTKEEIITLTTYRLERANESLRAAQLMLDNHMYIPAMNRIYYSMFYAVQALLILDDSAFSKHGQVKGFFNKNYIKNGVFPKEFGKMFNTVFEYRQKFDYVDLLIPEKQLISDYLVKANNFIEKKSAFIENKLASLLTAKSGDRSNMFLTYKRTFVL
jgi:hypothetical protein